MHFASRLFPPKLSPLPSVLYAFDCARRGGDLDACNELARRAFELMRENPMHCLLHRDWAERLIGASQLETAEASALAYLEFLKGCDRPAPSTQNRIPYWAALLQKHAAALPKSVEFFTANFPEESLTRPLPSQRFLAKTRLAVRGTSQKPKKK
jgi:hypothetical protein